MRITADQKQATRKRIIEEAMGLFRSRGFDATTTRDIARAAGIATGTLFNYFETKEALVGVLAGEALARAHAAWDEGSNRENGESRIDLEEELFSLVAAELRQLKPLRKFISPFLEIALSPLLASSNIAADGLRTGHLELVATIARRHGSTDLAPIWLQMYWALYTGVLTFWAADRSPRQEDTLALLDESMNMFSAWLFGQAGESKDERS